MDIRHLLEENDLTEDILKLGNAHLAEKGLLLKRGIIVDAITIAVPSSTKERPKANATLRCTRPGRATSGTSA